MANVIIRIELRGDPGGDVYKRLHDYMTGKNWYQTITSGSGQIMSLPHAMYSGATDLELPTVAQAFKNEIESSIWAKGAVVMVIGWNAWGMSI